MYLGWDIGIKNLAYCLIKKIPPTTISQNTPHEDTKNILKLGNNYYQIVDWDVINIIPRVSDFIHQRGEVMLQQRPIVKCRAQISKKGQNKGQPTSTNSEPHYCGKTALICLDTNPTYDPSIAAHQHGYHGFCGTHKKQAELTPDSYLDAKLTNSYCAVMVTDTDSKADNSANTGDKRCGSKSIYIDRKHYFRGICKKHYNLAIKEGRVKEADFLKVIRGKKSTQLDITHIGTALFDELANRPHLHKDSTCVLLENQPVLTNPTMKSVQMFVHSYFMDYGIRNPDGNVTEIHCYSASKKLDLIKHVSHDTYETIKTEVKTIPKKYGRHKRIAIRLCENFLAPNSIIGLNCTELYNQFRTSKKKDDLADSLLMTLHYLEREELKKMHTDNILKSMLTDTTIMTDNDPLIDSGPDDNLDNPDDDPDNTNLDDADI